MATVTNFVKWFKDRTKKRSGGNKDSTDAQSSNVDIVRLGQVPRVPPLGGAYDEYGFRMKEHIYEEIDVDADSVRNADFSQAAEVGPYLIVPIAGNGQRNDCGEDDDVFVNGNPDIDNPVAETPYDVHNSLYNSIPEWMRADMKQQNRKRHGIAIKQEKVVPEVHDVARYGGGISDGGYLNPTSKNMAAKSKSKTSRSKSSDGILRPGKNSDVCDEDMIDMIYQRANNVLPPNSKCNNAKTRCSSVGNDSFSDYDINGTDIDNILTEKEYEYFLVKAEKNFQLEQELKRYVDDSSSSEYGNSLASAEEYCSSNCSVKQSKCCRGCIDKRHKEQRKSQKGVKISQALILVPKSKGQGQNHPHSNIINKTRPNHKKNVSWCSLESLNSSNYSSGASSSGHYDMSPFYSRSDISRSSTPSSVENIRARSDKPVKPPQTPADPHQKTFSRAVSDRLSCRATNQKPEVVASRHAPTEDSDIYGSSIYGSTNLRQNRILADVMRRNHDRQLMML